MRRDLAKKKWPKPGEVSVAEMVQQTPPDEAAPGNPADEPLAARVEVARSPWQPEKLLVRVAIKAKQTPVPARPPASLVFAIDVSQSMAGPNRLPLVQEGIRLLVQRLRPEDRVAVVTYAARAQEALPGIPLGGKALELRNCLGGLEASGQTNGYEGLQLAYETARRGRVESGLNVVVLCTDGNFNLGETDETVLASMAAHAAAEGINLAVFGFGRSDRNDLRLELLAAKGGGRSCYVNTREEAERLLATQIDGLFEAAAQDVALTVKFNPERAETIQRIDGGTEAVTSAAVAELLPGRSLEALYEVGLKPGGEGAGRLGRLDMSYRLPGVPGVQGRSVALEAPVQDWAQADPSFRFAAAWAEFGRILQGERAHAGAELDRLEDWVQRYLPDDTGGYRSELLENVAAARVAAGGG
jgi:Ca-activated chloride channel family protein